MDEKLVAAAILKSLWTEPEDVLTLPSNLAEGVLEIARALNRIARAMEGQAL